jgi:cupin superfamily acireductone dioxygenase involved in methionine salvage
MHLVEKMREIKRSFDEVSNEITNMGNLDLLKPVDRIYKKLEKVTDRIRFADHGYKGFFDVVSVDFPELEKLYNFDLSMNDDIAALKEKVEMLTKALDTDTLLPHLETFMKSIDEFNEKIISRDEVITTTSGGN